MARFSSAVKADSGGWLSENSQRETDRYGDGGLCLLTAYSL